MSGFFDFLTMPHETTNINFQIVKEALESYGGSRKFGVAPATSAPSAAAAADADVTVKVECKLLNNADEHLTWYQGKVKVTIATTSSAGVPHATDGVKTITTASGGTNVTNFEFDAIDGSVKLDLVLEEGTWVAAETVTLTFAAPSTGVNPVITGITSATHVATLAV